MIQEKDTKKILLVCDIKGGIPFINNLFKYLTMSGKDIQVDLYDIANNRLIKQDSFNDEDFNFNTVSIVRNVLIRKIYGLKRKINLYFNMIRICNDYDVINFHFFCKDYYFLSKFIKGKKILTLWGSDFNYASRLDLYYLKKCFTTFESVTCTGAGFRQKIIQKCGVIAEVIQVVPFGLEPLAYFDSSLDKVFLKNKYGFPVDKKLVVLGYNGNRTHQHLIALKSIIKILSPQERDTLCVVLPMTYARDTAYVDEIRQLASNFSYDIIIFEKSLSDREIAEFRMCADIMINVLKNDQLSGSMQEYLYAGASVITGAWLPYQSLYSAGIYLRTINEVEEVGGALRELLLEYEGDQSLCKVNKVIIAARSHWGSVIKIWFQLFGVDCAERVS